MAIEIIRPGNPVLKDPVYRYTCTQCKTLFKFNRSDARPSFDPRDKNLLEIDCPMCKHVGFVNTGAFELDLVICNTATNK